MDFKCDGLHDGFYASIAHKCQVRYCDYSKSLKHEYSCNLMSFFDSGLPSLSLRNSLRFLVRQLYGVRPEDIHLPIRVSSRLRKFGEIFQQVKRHFDNTLL